MRKIVLGLSSQNLMPSAPRPSKLDAKYAMCLIFLALFMMITVVDPGMTEDQVSIVLVKKNNWLAVKKSELLPYRNKVARLRRNFL